MNVARPASRGGRTDHRGGGPRGPQNRTPTPNRNQGMQNRNPQHMKQENKDNGTPHRGPRGDREKNERNQQQQQQKDTEQQQDGQDDEAGAAGRKNEKKFTQRCRLFVGNLTPDTTEDEFKEMFRKYGEVSEVFLNKAKGFGFIRLVSSEGICSFT